MLTTEDELKNSIATSRNMSHRLDLLTRGYEEIASAYHQLAALVSNDRHTCDDWKMCNELTCVEHKKFLLIVNK